MRTSLLTLTLTLALSLPGLASADVYKCPAPDGKTIYQDRPCQRDTRPILRNAHTEAKEHQAAEEAQAIARRQEAEREHQERVAGMLAGLQKIPRPADYQSRIDVAFSLLLKDPASRQIRYTALPWGSLVCGTVNAKNSFGGFTGAQPFVIYFTEQQRIGHFKVYTDKEIQRAKLTVSGSLDEAIEKVLVEACHL
jgi:hypothetical protein